MSDNKINIPYIARINRIKIPKSTITRVFRFSTAECTVKVTECDDGTFNLDIKIDDNVQVPLSFIEKQIEDARS